MTWFRAPVLWAAACLLVAIAACKKDGSGLADSGVHPDAHIIPMGGFFCDLPGDNPAGLTLPDGFCARKFAELKAPRTIEFAPNGDVFVASPSAGTPGGASPGPGAIMVLPDDDHDGVADTVSTFWKTGELGTVHGLAFVGGNALVYSVVRAVYSIAYASGDRTAQNPSPTMIADLSDTGSNDRFTHTLGLGSDGQLWVTRGQYDSSFCPPHNPRSGSVLRIGANHDIHGDVVAQGFRNPMYMRCAPWGACYAAELSGDGWTQIGGSEKFVELKDGQDYGYPCCVDKDNPVPGSGADCGATPSSLYLYQLHDTPFGFDWDTNGLWPAPYTNALFIGFHGSFYEGPWAGTRLAWAPIDPMTHYPMGSNKTCTADTDCETYQMCIPALAGGHTQFCGPKTLASGFGINGPIKGRVTDVRMAPDGRLFFSDDAGGAVYWVAPKTLRRP
jgi:glucose/arabinose dehydrogenase